MKGSTSLPLSKISGSAFVVVGVAVLGLVLAKDLVVAVEVVVVAVVV